MTFIVVALLTGLVVFLFKWRIPTSRYLLQFNPYLVEKILLKNSHGIFRFEKKDGEWWVQEPIVRRAQQKIVGAIVARLVTLKPIRELPKEANHSLKDFGLVDPPIEIELFLPEQKERLGLKIGNRTAMESHLYAQLLDRPSLYLFPSLFLHQFNQGILEWIERRWIPVGDGSQLQSIQVEFLGDFWNLIKRGNQWILKDARGEKPIALETMTKIFRAMNDVSLNKILDKSTSEDIVPILDFPGDLSLTFFPPNQAFEKISFYFYSRLFLTKDPRVPDQVIRIHQKSLLPLLDLFADLRQFPERPWRSKKELADSNKEVTPTPAMEPLMNP